MKHLKKIFLFTLIATIGLPITASQPTTTPNAQPTTPDLLNQFFSEQNEAKWAKEEKSFSATKAFILKAGSVSAKTLGGISLIPYVLQGDCLVNSIADRLKKPNHDYKFYLSRAIAAAGLIAGIPLCLYTGIKNGQWGTSKNLGSKILFTSVAAALGSLLVTAASTFSGLGLFYVGDTLDEKHATYCNEHYNTLVKIQAAKKLQDVKNQTDRSLYLSIPDGIQSEKEHFQHSISPNYPTPAQIKMDNLGTDAFNLLSLFVDGTPYYRPQHAPVQGYTVPQICIRQP